MSSTKSPANVIEVRCAWWTSIILSVTLVLASGMGLLAGVLASSGCGGVQNFAYDPHSIPMELERMLRRDVIVPNGCNTCSDDRRAVWIAPGDLCRLQEDGMAAYHGVPLLHCSTQYKNDFNVTHHVKACLSIEDLQDLWLNHGFCHSPTTGLPYYDLMKEGLLFCTNCPVTPYGPNAECCQTSCGILAQCACASSCPAYPKEEFACTYAYG